MSESLADFPDGWERALVIAAHPDDIEWGAAAAVAAWTAAGKEVVYVLVTSGEAGIDTMDPEGATVTRQAEEHASASIVGVVEVEFLGHPDGRVEENLTLRRDLAGAIRRYRPDVVVAQNHDERWGPDAGAGWNSADHRAVGRATIDAVSDAGNRWIFSELAANEPWSGVQWIAIAGSARGTHAVDVTDVFDVGVASLAAHAEYLRALGTEDPKAFARETLSGQTTAVAEQFGGRAGIAFELIRGPAAP